MILIGRDAVARRLDHATAIRLVRAAMIALERGTTRQLLRQIIDLDHGNAFGVMPGAIDGEGFGAKIISVFPGNAAIGRQSHQGMILLFDPADGLPVALVHAGEVTAIRTAAASAAATDALARADARSLAILGTGEQAWHHALAIAQVRALERVTLWARTRAAADALAERIAAALGIPATVAATPAEAVAEADIVCTVSAAPEPILIADAVRPGTHVNAVGSSRAGPCEIDPVLVARSRFVPDYRPGVLAQGAEYLRARDAGLADETHVLDGIGAVFDGRAAGRTGEADITIYKSLGHIVQDIACAAWLREAAERDGFGTKVAF